MFQARGFTLIEVLISMVILAIGLLGLAAMQAISLRDNLDSYNYQQATLLAYEMQDRIKGNSDYWKLNIANPNYSSTACTKDAPCTAEQMAANDYGYWQESVESTLPKLKDGTDATAIIEDSNNQGGGCKDTYPTSVCLVTTWGRANNKDSNKASKLDNEAHFYLEVTP
jgi:type IV pilus assembly protein PilV